MSQDILGIIGRREPVIGRPVVVEHETKILINKRYALYWKIY